MRIDGTPGAAVPTTGGHGTELRVAQFNVLNFFDTVDDPATSDQVTEPAEYRNKLTKLALALRDTLQGADLVAMEEVENQRVLDDLLAQPALAELGYKSAFVEGNDARGIDTAILYRADRVKLDELTTATPDAPAGMPDAGGSIDPGKLFARPPLIATFTVQGAAQAAEGAQQVTLIANHFKSKRGEQPGMESRRVEQAKYVAGLVDAKRAAQSGANVIVLGDLNTLPGEQPLTELAKHADGSDRMFDAPDQLPEKDRYSFVFQGKHNLLDHMFVTPELHAQMSKVEIPHINSGQHGDQRDTSRPDHVSDHDPLIATFRISGS